MNSSCPNYTAPLTSVPTTLIGSVSLVARSLARRTFFLLFQSDTGKTLTKTLSGDRRSLSRQCRASPCMPGMCVAYTGLFLIRLVAIGVGQKGLIRMKRPTKRTKIGHFMCLKMVCKSRAHPSTHPNAAAEPTWKIFQSFTNTTHVDLCWIR